MGIEPTFEAWEAPVLPLNYTREVRGFHHSTVGRFVESPLDGRGMVVVRIVGDVFVHRCHPGIPKNWG
jgi:hypothetical protein